MLSQTESMPARSPAPGVIPNPVTGPVSDEPPVVSAAGRDQAQPPAGRDQAQPPAANGGETRTEHFRRKAHRGRLHGYAIVGVALGAFLIALAASNTARVKVNWVFGSSRVSLIWLVLFAAVLGWLIGLMASARFHWRTRAPRGRGATS